MGSLRVDSLLTTPTDACGYSCVTVFHCNPCKLRFTYYSEIKGFALRGFFLKLVSHTLFVYGLTHAP